MIAHGINMTHSFGYSYHSDVFFHLKHSFSTVKEQHLFPTAAGNMHHVTSSTAGNWFLVAGLDISACSDISKIYVQHRLDCWD